MKLPENLSRKKLILLAILLLILLSLPTAIFLAQKQTQYRGKAGGNTYYVSKTGNNSDGRSWATAWNELNQINWSVIQPGNTILLDGGSTAMTYTTTLSVSKGGTSGSPITIKLGSEAGRNGKVVIDGQGSRRTGININNSWIIIDGVKRYGIEVTGHTWAGIEAGGSGDNVTLQYFHSHHNPPNPSGGDIFGMRLDRSDNLTIRRCEINDNGQDAIQSIPGGDNFLLEECYIHSHHYNHPDAVQWEGGDSMIIRRNVFENDFMQGIFLGANHAGHNWPNINVEIYDNLFYDFDYGIKSKNSKTTNWEIHHNTFVDLNQFAIEWCCAQPGAEVPMSIHDNIFVNCPSGFYLNTGGGTTNFSDNCLYQTVAPWDYVSGSGNLYNTDPQFVNPGNRNYALKPGSPCTGKGSTITSLDQLLGQPAPTPGPTSTPGLSPTPTPSPTPKPTNTPTPRPTATPTPRPTSTPTPRPTVTPTPVPPTVTPTPPVHCLPLGDIDCSGKVDSLDFSYLLARYKTSDPKSDLDDSGQVNALDVSILLSNFGKSG